MPDLALRDAEKLAHGKQSRHWPKVHRRRAEALSAAERHEEAKLAYKQAARLLSEEQGYAPTGKLVQEVEACAEREQERHDAAQATRREARRQKRAAEVAGREAEKVAQERAEAAAAEAQARRRSELEASLKSLVDDPAVQHAALQAKRLEAAAAGVEGAVMAAASARLRDIVPPSAPSIKTQSKGAKTAYAERTRVQEGRRRKAAEEQARQAERDAAETHAQTEREEKQRRQKEKGERAKVKAKAEQAEKVRQESEERSRKDQERQALREMREAEEAAAAEAFVTEARQKAAEATQREAQEEERRRAAHAEEDAREHREAETRREVEARREALRATKEAEARRDAEAEARQLEAETRRLEQGRREAQAQAHRREADAARWRTASGSSTGHSLYSAALPLPPPQPCHTAEADTGSRVGLTSPPQPPPLPQQQQVAGNWQQLLQAETSAQDKLSCPITHALMQNPVVAADGMTYEKVAIERWLESHDSSPTTGETLDHKFVVPNHLVRGQIHRLTEGAAENRAEGARRGGRGGRGGRGR